MFPERAQHIQRPSDMTVQGVSVELEVPPGKQLQMKERGIHF